MPKKSHGARISDISEQEREVQELSFKASDYLSQVKVSDEMLFYMASRGVTKEEALRMVVLGTAEVVTKRIPVEYAVEVDRLIELELGGGVG